MAQLQEARKSKLLYYIPFFPSVGLDCGNTVAPLSEYLLCARHSTRIFNCIVSFNLCNNTVIISSSLQAGEVSFQSS